MSTPPNPAALVRHEFEWQVPVQHPAFAGHFPGQPLLPGVAVLSEVLERVLAVPGLRSRLGPSLQLSNAKFLSPVTPGMGLRIMLAEEPAQLRFEVCRNDAVVVAQGRWAWPRGGAAATPAAPPSGTTP